MADFDAPRVDPFQGDSKELRSPLPLMIEHRLSQRSEAAIQQCLIVTDDVS